MYFKPSARVHLIVVPEYGERIRDMPRNELVYVADTSVNGRVVRRTWLEPMGQNDISVRVFPISQDKTPEDWVSDITPALDLHHGECSCGDEAYSVLHVVGVPLTERLRAELQALGFQRYEEAPDGFVAQKVVRAA